MTTTTIMAKLRAAIFGGAVVLLPGVALADNPSVPDHAEAEARGGAADVIPTVEKVEGVPDHAEAQARGGAETTIPTAEKMEGVPDHAEAESRGAVPQQ